MACAPQLQLFSLGFVPAGFVQAMPPLAGHFTPFMPVQFPTPVQKVSKLPKETAGQLCSSLDPNIRSFVENAAEESDKDEEPTDSDNGSDKGGDEDDEVTQVLPQLPTHPLMQQHLHAPLTVAETKGCNQSVPCEETGSLLPPNNPHHSRIVEPLQRHHSIRNRGGHHPHMTPHPNQVAFQEPMHNPTCNRPAPQIEHHEHVPQPPVIPKKPHKRAKKKNMQKTSDILLGQHFKRAEIVGGKDIVNTAKTSAQEPVVVKTHYLLAAETCRQYLYFNAISPPPTDIHGHSLFKHVNDPVTDPPLPQIHVWTGVNTDYVTIANDHGVTIGNFFDGLGEELLKRVGRAQWDSFSEEKRERVGMYFYHNRKHGKMPPRERGLICTDLLGSYSIFGGILPISDEPATNSSLNNRFRVKWMKP